MFMQYVDSPYFLGYQKQTTEAGKLCVVTLNINPVEYRPTRRQWRGSALQR